MQPISFAVPQTFAGGVPFPTTLIVSKLTETSSTLSNIAQSSMQVPAGTQRFSSATLGAEFLLDFTPAIIKAAPFTPPNPQVRPAVFPAGDQIQTASFKPYYSVQIPANTTASFDESFTFELRYLPEPSAPLMLGSGAGLLGLLASVVGPRLGS